LQLAFGFLFIPIAARRIQGSSSNTTKEGSNRRIQMGYIFSFLIALIVAAVVIYIVGRLNLGLSVSGFGAAIIAALVIAVVGTVVMWLIGLLGLTFGGGWLGAIIYIIIAAIVLMISDRFVPGMKVNGFTGAIIAAIAIGVVAWIVTWLLGLLGLGV
jgi:putative membrane protein